MFILYMANLADVVQNCQVNFHSFADDSQIYLHCPLSGVSSAIRKFEDCISEVGHWMSANRLKLNADKTESAQGTSWPHSEAALHHSSLAPMS